MMRTPFPYVLNTSAIVLFSLGIICSLVVFFLDANLSLFTWVNQVSLFTGKTIWVFFTLLAETQIIIAILIFFLIPYPAISWAYALLFIPGALITQGSKYYFEVLRPAGVLGEESIHIIGDTLVYDAFPSGHTTTIFALLAVILASHLSKNLKLTLLTLAILAGLSRIAIGAHWPIDVLSGISLGILLGSAAAFLFNKKPVLASSLRANQLLALLCLSIAASVFFREVPPFKNYIWLENSMAVCIIILGLWRFPRKLLST